MPLGKIRAPLTLGIRCCTDPAVAPLLRPMETPAVVSVPDRPAGMTLANPARSTTGRGDVSGRGKIT